MPSTANGRVARLAGVASLGWLVTYETVLALLGFPPTVDDGVELWCVARERSVSSQDPIVVVGTSRILTAFDLPAAREEFPGREIVQLAWPGKHPIATLESLIEDERFTGSVIVDATVESFLPIHREDQRFLNAFYEDDWSWLKAIERHASTLLQTHSRVFSWEANPLRIAEAVVLRGELPEVGAYRSAVDRNYAIDSRLTGAEQLLAGKISRLENGRPLWSEGSDAGMASQALGVAYELKEGISRLRERGGEVVFARWPEHPDLSAAYPSPLEREALWRRIMQVLGAPSLHHVDVPTLQGFDFPDGTHLALEQRAAFTQTLSRELAPLLRVARTARASHH